VSGGGGVCETGNELENTQDERLERWPNGRERINERSSRSLSTGPSEFPPFPSNTEAWTKILRERPEVEPAIRGVADGVSPRVDRLRACGNAVVPLTAAWAFTSLARKLGLSE